LTDVGVLRLHFVIGFANDKVPLRMTGLKRVPISQRADGGVKGKAHCAISVVPTLAQRTRKGWATPGAGCAGGPHQTWKSIERVAFEY
jgi:hypothetical protein